MILAYITISDKLMNLNWHVSNKQNNYVKTFETANSKFNKIVIPHGLLVASGHSIRRMKLWSIKK